MSAADSRMGHPTLRKPGRPAYEELHPRSEWEDNAGSHVLNVSLPGFVKEQLKLTYDEPTQSLNVRGERAIGPGWFVWFNKDFGIPDNARFNDMRSKFQSETLIVTVPKQTPTPPPPPLPPLPPQAPKPGPTTSRRTASPKEDDTSNNGPWKLPATVKKVDDRMEKQRLSTFIPQTPAAPLPNPAPKPVPTPAPRTEITKENNGMKDEPKEQDDSVKLWRSKEMKVAMAEEKKLMVNVVAASIVLVAIGAYIAMGGRN